MPDGKEKKCYQNYVVFPFPFLIGKKETNCEEKQLDLIICFNI